MDIQRLILFIVFSMSVLLLWEAWQREQQGGAPAPAEVQAPRQAPPTPGKALATARPAAVPQGPVAGSVGQKVVVTTDVMRAEIDTLGGSLVRLVLLQHRDTLDQSKPFVLFDQGQDRTYIAQSGLIGDDLPNHKTLFTAEANSYQLAPGADTLQVRLTAPESHGVQVTKVYTFRRGSYVVDVAFEITDRGAQAVKPFAYFQFVRDGKPPVGDPRFVHTYTGVAVYTAQDKFRKESFSDIDKGKVDYPKNADNGWIAMLQHYFLAAWLPPDKLQREYYTRRLGPDLYSAGVIVPAGEIGPGKTASVSIALYAGPQEQEALAKLAPGLNLTVDYGWLTVIATPLFWVLSWFHRWSHNWGVAIILLTVLIKLLFFPLSAASYRSMAKMRTVAPRMQKLKELYGHDRQKLHQAMMELYKEEKINPLGGCLPIVIQIPVFISLYWVLLASVELRHAPFVLWIKDLSAPDPYYVLPVIMGITMFIQTKLNPTPPDPIQARVMQIMPLAFSVFFFFFPSGLVLYWLVNNVLSIAQQWYITRSLGQVAAAHGRR